ncbi:MAG: hypothetical protein J7641_11440 [Cyanobacteria bacterium SID2]|nr:hypothetical protein [Cyanobacteria bacterium SID2]MBP0005806.1 hypothetical protein [Cyanobacteria bacterium SBC]
MTKNKETLPPAIEDDPVFLDPTTTEKPEDSPYLYRPTLTGDREDTTPVFPLLEDRQPPDEMLDGDLGRISSGLSPIISETEEDSVALEAAIRDEAAALMSGRLEESIEVTGVDDEVPETLHPIL